MELSGEPVKAEPHWKDVALMVNAKIWDKHEMNVSLAVQTISSSVAYDIDFLNLKLQPPESKNSDSKKWMQL